MPTHTLLNSSEDLFQKLLSDFDEFSRNLAFTYKAMDCALSAWHLTDWVYNEWKRSTYGHHGDSKGLGDMRDNFYLSCPTLKVMHDITNGSKHLELKPGREKSNMAQSHTSFEDRVAPTISETFGDDWLLIDFQDGTEETMYVLVSEAVEFWRSYFGAKNLLPVSVPTP